MCIHGWLSAKLCAAFGVQHLGATQFVFPMKLLADKYGVITSFGNCVKKIFTKKTAFFIFLQSVLTLFKKTKK